MRLIDADALIAEYPDDVLTHCDIEATPIVDARPVAHGKWEDKPPVGRIKSTNIPVVQCSECGITFCDIINNHHYMYRYCPYCGAVMDAEVETNETD